LYLFKELALIFEANAEAAGARDFVTNNYRQIKRLNPRLPFLIREIEESDPMLVARYDYAGESTRELADLSEAEVKEKLRELYEIGTVALKANLYPCQESVPQDLDIVNYDPYNPDMHHL